MDEQRLAEMEQEALRDRDRWIECDGTLHHTAQPCDIPVIVRSWVHQGGTMARAEHIPVPTLVAEIRRLDSRQLPMTTAQNLATAEAIVSDPEKPGVFDSAGVWLAWSERVVDSMTTLLSEVRRFHRLYDECYRDLRRANERLNREADRGLDR